ncbi:hypothetical protein DFJ73DRAFT_771736 [Zopfochytrium polystomum]|nr:hypothetical protein DFJ73DRAFT_771736 [Zopfochytrium polystomum]
MGLPPAAEEDDDEDEDDDEEETERTFAGSNTADPMLQVTDQPIALATSAAGGAENREEMDMHDDISSAQMPIDTASTSLEVTASGSSSSQRPVLPVGAPGSPSTVPLFAAAATALQSGSTHALLQHLPQPEREHHVDHSESQLQDLRTPEILPPIQPANEANAPTAAVTARAGGAPLVNGLDALLRPFNFGLIANGDDDMDLRDVPAIQFADLASQLVHMVRESPKLAELMGMAGPVKQVLKGQQQGQGSADGAGMLLESWKANSKELQMGLGAKVKKLTVPSFDCAVSWLPVLNMMLPNLQW